MKHLKSFNIFESNFQNQEEIDSILDKISQSGIKSLTNQEKMTLDNSNNLDFDYKKYLISKIERFMSNQEDGLTMQELHAGSSPLYTEQGQDIDLIERLFPDQVEVIRYGGYKYETELKEYYVNYEDLSVENLEDIIDLIGV